MNDQEFFGLKYSLLSKDETISTICQHIDIGDKGFQRGDLNVATIVTGQKNPTLKEALNQADIINMDGVGAIWGARLLGLPTPERITGVDLFVNLLEVAERRKYSVYFLGATDDVLNKMVGKIKSKHPNINIAGQNNGYFWSDEEGIVSSINSLSPDMLFIGIKSPEKELFAQRWKNKLNAGLIMGVGGSFDVVSGKTKRAPVAVQKCGLEWLYRIYQEPQRMWRRYLSANTQFLKMLAQEKITSLRKNNSSKG